MSSTDPQHDQTPHEPSPTASGKLSFDMKVVLVVVGVLFLAFIVGGLF